MLSISLSTLTNKLGYDVSTHYFQVNTVHLPETAHIFRSTTKLGVEGIYFFERGKQTDSNNYPPAPAVFLAQAKDEDEARIIHRKLWNLCSVPFLIVLLPHQIRVYTGFNYREEDPDAGLLDEISEEKKLKNLIEALSSVSIDTGFTWKSKYAEKLDSNQRVDKRLLENIDDLGKALTTIGGLEDKLANALIGKFIYLKYLRDKGILTDEWMLENNIRPDTVFSLNPTVNGLRKLVLALENRFNGRIFPIDFDAEQTLNDKHIKWASAIFSGAKIVDTGFVDAEGTPDIIFQLHLAFKAYDFDFIPVETLSSIYEQFIFDRKTKGAVYTPEALADYMICDMESFNPLERGAKVLDPACGSGIFLVLVYRLLIEKEIHRQGRNLNAEELLNILGESIYGIEREPDACYVTEFSLILTLLHYLEPRDLQNLNFRFPSLHNHRIFESDFFDIDDEKNPANFIRKNLTFDWIIGNPPWISLKTADKKKENAPAFKWMNNPENKKQYPVGDYQVAEAFSWIAPGLLGDNGITGFILPATGLFNLKSRPFRTHFFSKNELLKVTNFANLRDTVWGKRENRASGSNPTFPPAILIFRPTKKGREKSDIIHYSPFEINRPIKSKNKDKPWVITVNKNEINWVSPNEIETGEALPWKLALWGSYLDKRIIERIKYAFPMTLSTFCEKKKFNFSEGPQIGKKKDGYYYEEELKDKKRFEIILMEQSPLKFSITSGFLKLIPESECYIRKRGGKAGLKLTKAPHIILSSSWMSFIIYSDMDFFIPPRQIGISAPEKTDENRHYLKALSVYLQSGLVAYILFFQAPEWGIFRQAKRITIHDVRNVPIPDFTPEQIRSLAYLHEEIVDAENREISRMVSSLENDPSLFPVQSTKHVKSSFENLSASERKSLEPEIDRIRKDLQFRIDKQVYEILNIPPDIRRVIDDFIEYRLPLDTPSKQSGLIKMPTDCQLENYARILKETIDDFLMGISFVNVKIIRSKELIECIIEVIEGKEKIPGSHHISVEQGNNTMALLMEELSGNLREQVSQWVYIRRGLRLFDGPRIHIYKTPRVIDWTATHALIDAGDIIGELIPGHDN